MNRGLVLYSQEFKLEEIKLLNEQVIPATKMEPQPLFATSLLDLNDYCLFAILDDMSVKDLCSVTRSCTRLRDIGRNIFHRKHKICDLEFIEMKKSAQVIRMLEIFGPLIVELKIDLDDHSHPHRDIVSAISVNCTALESLTLLNYRIPDDREKIAEMGTLFRRLKKLILKWVVVKHVRYTTDGHPITPNGNTLNIFDGCDSVSHLEVKCCKGLEQIILSSTQFSNLQRFVFRSVTKRCYTADFILRHRNLRSIFLLCPKLDYEFVLKAAAQCKHLDRLRFSLSLHNKENSDLLVNDISMDLARLQNLRELRISDFGTFTSHTELALIKALPKLSSLEILSLEDGCVNIGVGNGELLMSCVSQLENLRAFEFMSFHKVNGLKLIKKLKHLTELHLNIAQKSQLFEASDLVEMVKCLNKLTKLTVFVGELKISEKTYGQLVDAVNLRPLLKYRILNLCCQLVANDSIDSSHSLSVKIIDDLHFRDFFQPFPSDDRN